MVGDVVKDILAELKDARKGDDVSLAFGEPGYSPKDFSKDNFHKILPKSASRMFFIDGGNAEIFSAPNLCLHFVRIACLGYEGNKRSSLSSDEFYVLCSAKSKDGKLSYEAKLFVVKIGALGDDFLGKEFLFNPLDKELCEGSARMDLARVPGLVRRFAELSAAKAIASASQKGDAIIIDGDFTSRSDEERRLINAIKRIALGRENSVCALSKTSSLLTSSGNAVSVALSRLAPFDCWYYSDVASQDSGSTVCFAKLHPSSSYVFKVEGFGFDKETDSRIGSIFSSIASNSRDPVFLGYPYGLVEADTLARVSNKEREFLRTVFIAKAGKDFASIASACRSLDAHSVLDRISY
jgi:hypothetical protein